MPIIRRLSVALGLVACLSLVPLLAWDLVPARFPSGAHDALGAFPLVAVAFGCLATQAERRPPSSAWVRSSIVAAAFLAWAVNQFWPQHALATAWNDLAITLFVVDIVLGILEKQQTSPLGAEASPNQKTR
jgi:hypothetical protein